MSRNLPSIRSAKNLKNKTIIVRCDFDVPLKGNKIKDDSRLKAALPTINFLLKKQVKQIILIGHLGRPKGQVMPELSLAPVAKHLEKLLLLKDQPLLCHSRRPRPAILREQIGNQEKNKIKINFINQFTNYKLQITNYKIVLLENLRFNPAEETNDKTFAQQLASLADIYINEAFAVSHRSAASIDAIKKYLPSFAGLNLEQEINNLSYVLKKPKHPLVAIIGGAKIETKLPVIQQFLKTADYILVGGAVANDFLLAKRQEVGDSLVDKDYINQAKKILQKLEIKNQKLEKNKTKKYQLPVTNYQLLLPIDYIWHKNKILDIGPKTIKNYCAIIKKAKTIVWNGPMGYFEDKKFAKGTNEIARAILSSHAKAVIGGGETGEAVKMSNSKFPMSKNNKFFISTGGGAMLEFLGGKKLPGLKK